jgi:cytochrome c-type biogenesis protein CcmF
VTAELGHLAVVLALCAALYSLVASGVGAHRRSAALIASGRRALIGVAALTTAATLALEVGFLSHDFSISFVWQTSSTTTPLLYVLTGLWGGQAGSLLFWSWLLSLFAAVAVLRPWRADLALMPWFTAICAGVSGFFLFLVAFVADPFERLPVVPPEGNGLNPLLQHPGMAFHPPSLYLGFTGLTIPYAFAMAALLARRTDAGWIVASRRWLLIAWAFLSVGLALGGRWAYDVLGWGGYWGWDPVENAALMPWLAATAFLHSVMVQERRGLFKVWNMSLVILTFGLTIVGTFLTRAGLVSSVHAFAQSDIGPYFLAFTALVLVGSLLLLWRRLPDLATTVTLDSMVSREGAFMANNVLFIGALFAVLWGTLFPLFSEVLVDQRVTVGPPYFNRMVGPIFWAIILLMGIGPLVGWQRADPRRLARELWRPAVASLAITGVLFVLGVGQWIALIGLSSCAFALIVTALEIGRGVGARVRRGERPLAALAELFARNRRRYGGYVVHIGIALLAIGVIGSTMYRQEAERSLAVGEALRVGGYELTYQGSGSTVQPDKQTVFARLAVARDGRPLGLLTPSREVFRLREGQPMTIPSMLHRPLADVYALLGLIDPETERVTVKVYVNPLIGWVWFGMLTLVAGTLIAAWPDAAEQRVMNTELKRLLESAGATTG